MRPLTRVALALALASACTIPVHAADAAPRPALATGRTDSPVRIDGVLDEAAWASASATEGFLLIGPREGQAPDESTTVRVLRDGDRVVFGIWCQAKRAPHSGLAPRDQITDGDHLSLHLDTDGDGARAYIFGVNPYGVQLDGILTLEPDFKWDGVWDAAAHRGAGEWTAEIALPFRIMRISAAGRPWRLWVRREITAWNEVSSWPPYRNGTPGPIMLQAGDLTGLEDVQGGQQFTVEPYLFGTSSGDRALAVNGGTGGWNDDNTQDVGVDVQAAVTSSLVMNATINPDFSQIEADALQIDVNRRFPLQFREKRPFFLEGADQFQSLMDLVQTRRMADPRWGTKFTGRVRGWNTGALLVRDGGGSVLAGSAYSPHGDTNSTGDLILSRPGWYTLGRAQLPFGEGANIGLLYGAHRQDEESRGLSVRQGHTLNGFGGFDSQLRLSQHWTTEAQIVGSMTHLDSVGVANQNNNFHDWMGVWRFRYRDRARELHFGARHLGEKFRDEVGYQDYSGVTYRRLGGYWDLFPKTGPLQRIAPIFDVLLVHDHTGRLELSNIETSTDWEFRGNAFLNVGYVHNDEHWIDRTYPLDRVHVFANWLAWRPLALDLEVNVGDAIYFRESRQVWNETYTLNATARPGPRVTAAANIVRYRLADEPGGPDLKDSVWLLGVNTSVQFTRRLSARVYPQYDSGEKHLDVNGLLGYVVQPGTVFYAGVNSGWDPDLRQGPRRLTSRQVFAKASWRFAR